MSVAALLLAAGRGSRFGAGEGESKLAAALDGVPLVRRVAATVLASRASPLIVVTGHAAAVVEAALAGVSARFVHNADHASGLAGTLRVGLAAVPVEDDGALVLLADMPLVRPQTIDRLIAVFAQGAAEIDAVVPVFEGRHGNPVLIGRRLFPALAELRGDQGARKLLEEPGRAVRLCEVDDAGIIVDVDTREALRALSKAV